MARISNRSRLEQLADEFEPLLKAAFLEAIADISNRAELGRIAERLERGDIAGAIEAVHLDPAAFRQLDSAIGMAFDAGGRSGIGALPVLRDPSGARFVIRWDGRNVRAENWLRSHSATLVTRITEDQRILLRAALSEGMAAGRNPKSVALDIVGRLERASGRRVGGLLGLSSSQAEYVAAARAELLSGDPASLRAYLARGRRDKRFDAVVKKAIETETALDAATVSRLTGRYSDRLLALRGETIARTETMAALNQSGIEAMRQAVDAGAVRADVIQKIWHTARDPKVRDSHAAIDRQSVGLEQVFGNGLMYPGDPSGGAAEVANCRCWMETKIDFYAGLA